ncbi:MAG: hypothetical protein M3Y54_14615 [Bacteroidota bacterium]|nr:hypothetical protein [Bacteroidota bacterium]
MRKGTRMVALTFVEDETPKWAGGHAGPVEAALPNEYLFAATKRWGCFGYVPPDVLLSIFGLPVFNVLF